MKTIQRNTKNIIIKEIVSLYYSIKYLHYVYGHTNKYLNIYIKFVHYVISYGLKIL